MISNSSLLLWLLTHELRVWFTEVPVGLGSLAEGDHDLSRETNTRAAFLPVVQWTRIHFTYFTLLIYKSFLLLFLLWLASRYFNRCFQMRILLLIYAMWRNCVWLCDIFLLVVHYRRPRSSCEASTEQSEQKAKLTGRWEKCITDNRGEPNGCVGWIIHLSQSFQSCKFAKWQWSKLSLEGMVLRGRLKWLRECKREHQRGIENISVSCQILSWLVLHLHFASLSLSSSPGDTNRFDNSVWKQLPQTNASSVETAYCDAFAKGSVTHRLFIYFSFLKCIVEEEEKKKVAEGGKSMWC